jgi:hypothetical protein
MRLLLALIVSGAAFTAALLLSSAGVAAGWQQVRARLDALSPAARARLLAALRLLPAAAAALAALVTFLGFLRYEPPGVDESAGFVLLSLSGTGLLCVAAGLYRLAGALRQTRRTMSAWPLERIGTAESLPLFSVDAVFPIVAVIGVFRPRLLIARQVAARCDRRELDAMIAHELAHVRAGDNITRLLFTAAPIVPFSSRTGREIEQDWIAASEQAADDEARRSGQSGLALASAITKVARLATGSAPLVNASAILSGSGVEYRVRRLLEASEPLSAPRRYALPAAALCTAVVALLWTPLLRGAYEIAEYCVQNLP